MKNTIIILLITSLGFASCTKDWLEIEPVVNKTVETHYKNEADMNMAVLATYDPLQWCGSNFNTFEYHNFGLLSNVLSDDCWSGGGGSSDRVGYIAAETGRANPASADFYAMYITNFRGVARANVVIDMMEQVEEISDDAKTQFLGEAKFLRALFYFRLVRMWENIPLMTSMMSLDELKALPQANPNDVYNQIANDLLDAYNTLPDRGEHVSSEVGRATKWSAAGLLLRVYLYHNGYLGGTLTAGSTTIDGAKAREIADDIINNSGHGLITLDDLFQMDNENNNESLFEVQFTETGQWGDWTFLIGQEGNMLQTFYGMRGPDSDYWADGWSYGTVTQELYNEFEAGDPRRSFAILDPTDSNEGIASYNEEGFHNTGYFVKKYAPTIDGRGGPDNGGVNYHNNNLNEVLVRYADVLLMASELNLGVDDAKALDYLNRVRTRAMGAGAALSTIDIDAIYHERRVELAGEGMRYWDLLRRGLSYAQTMINGTDIPGTEFTSQFNLASEGLMPIPQNELDLSSAGWVQNPGY